MGNRTRCFINVDRAGLEASSSFPKHSLSLSSSVGCACTDPTEMETLLVAVSPTLSTQIDVVSAVRFSVGSQDWVCE